MLFIIRILLALLILVHSSNSSENRRRRRQQHFQIYWNSSNPFFHSMPAVLNARLGDTIDFFCPYSYDNSPPEYNTIYLVSEIDYNLCYTENYQPLVRCDQPYGLNRLIYTMPIAKFLPYPNTPEFHDGQSYYFISTSTGQESGIDQKFDGLCRMKNMRLIIDVPKFYRRYSANDIRGQQIRRDTLKNRTVVQTQQRIFSDSRRLSPRLLLLLLLLLLCSRISFWQIK